MSGQDWKVEAKQHFLSQRDPAQLKEIKVPEWPKLGAVYYFPARTAEEREAINHASSRRGDWAGIVETILVRGRDSLGELLFAEREREDLRTKYDPDVLQRIVLKMHSDDATIEDAEKNS